MGQQHYIDGSFFIVPNRNTLRGLPAITRSVYFSLCDRANGQGVCYPSIPTLASESGCGISAVYVALTELENNGLVERQNRNKDGRQTSNVYQLLLVTQQTPPPPHGGSPLRHTETNDTHLNDNSTAPKESSPRVMQVEPRKPVSIATSFRRVMSDDMDDLPTVDSETGLVAETPKVPRQSKNKAALDAVAYFQRACDRATGTKPLMNDKGYFLALRLISEANLGATDFRSLIDDWFEQNLPDEKRVQITHCFSTYNVNQWRARNPK